MPNTKYNSNYTFNLNSSCGKTERRIVGWIMFSSSMRSYMRSERTLFEVFPSINVLLKN